MAQSGVAPRRNNDALDDLFAYDASMDDIFYKEPPKDDPPRDDRPRLGMNKRLHEGLGIDEEIKIAKKRAPPAKLDETRLLSEKGIIKLRSSAKKNLRFKGKGHEFSDVQRLLSFYQLWLDDLYPKAKFADGLFMIEKLGHKSRVRMMRQALIDEGKTKDIGTERVENGAPSEKQQQSRSETTTAAGAPGERRKSLRGNEPERVDDDAETNEKGNENRLSSAENALPIDDAPDMPDEDELDALLAADAGVRPYQEKSLFGGGGNADIPQRPSEAG